MLIVRDTLSVPAIDHNLIPPFVIREAGINMRTTPKFQVEDPSFDDHSACFPKENLRALLKFHGALSYFTSTTPSIDMLNESN